MEYKEYQIKRNNKNYLNGNNIKNSDYNENDENDENEIVDSFKYFDINKEGKVNIDEIKQILTSFGDKMTEEEFDKIFKSVNINIDKNGFIDYINFINLWKNNE